MGCTNEICPGGECCLGVLLCPRGARTRPTLSQLLLVPLRVHGRCLCEPQANATVSFQPRRMVTGLTPTRSCWLWVRDACSGWHGWGWVSHSPWAAWDPHLGSPGDTDTAVPPQPLSLVSSGVANVLGSFVSSYPITGSFGRCVAGGGAGLSLGLCGEGALQDPERKTVLSQVGP